MKRIIGILFVLCAISCKMCYADNVVIEKEQFMQKKLDEIGFMVLNANALDKRIVFSYKEKRKKTILTPENYKRQIIVTTDDIMHASNEDELASIIAMRTAIALKSYDGAFKGRMGTFETVSSPKKYELIADRKAVEYMVKAGYNPIALITYINKTYPQKRQDLFSKHNLTSKRLMYIYEDIYLNYPYFLANNEYFKNEYYQNFLLNSVENRRKLEIAIKTKNFSGIKYE